MSNAFYLSSIESLYREMESGKLNADEWLILKRCNSQKNCESYMERFKDAEQEKLIPLIYKINLRYRSSAFPALNPFDAECLICVLEYEDVRRELADPKYLARRVRNSGRKNGWKHAIENSVLKKGLSIGFEFLHKGKRLDASFEFFILSNSQHFESNVLEAARNRLTAHGFVFGS